MWEQREYITLWVCVSVQKLDYCLRGTEILSIRWVLYECEAEEAVACELVHVNVCVSPVWGINIRETAEVRTNPGLFPWARPRTDRQLFTCYFPVDPNSDPGSLPRSVTVCWPPPGCSSWAKSSREIKVE